METSSPTDTNNPLNLGLEYTWQEGDTLAMIAHKYRRPAQWTELLDYNKHKIAFELNYLMRAGDTIRIPESWFPLPAAPSFGTKFIGSKGERVYANE